MSKASLINPSGAPDLLRIVAYECIAEYVVNGFS
jgi:hypothetical protein